jgi:hypothetical protein
MDAPGLIPSLIGAPLSPAGGPAAGTVEDLLVDATSRPVWLLVRLRATTRPYTFVPAHRMATRARAIVVPYDESALREAPVRLDGPGPFKHAYATLLSRYYGLRAPSSEPRPLHVSRAAA